ncbi:MAG: DUF1573 domain-containing protein [Bacteroidales bacterium]|nr:DUF1573 domain-containing protein [Bacteroidales bacterium]
MKKIVLALSFVMLVFMFSNAQEKINDNPNAPVIDFEKLVHDYGTIYQNGNGVCKFQFTNTGKEPLILSKPKSSCGCTVPTWPKHPILPGQTDEIKVTYATKRIGPINKNVTIYSNAKNKQVILRIKGKVIAKPSETLPEKSVDNTASPVNKNR